MVAVNIVPFKWYHLSAMDLREQEKQYLRSFDNYMDLARQQEKRGPCFTAVVENEGIACCYGFAQYWTGVYEAWLITSNLVERYPIQTIRTARREIDNFEIASQAHRLQMVVNTSFPLSIRFAEALFFYSEGVLKQYGPDGSDWLMLSRIRQNGWIVRR